MVVQDIKRGNYKKVEGEGLRSLMEESFGSSVSVTGDGWHCVEYGALKPLKVRIVSNSELEVQTTSDPDVSTEVAQETIRRYNRFLQVATGFDSKQRSKRIQKKAKEGKL